MDENEFNTIYQNLSLRETEDLEEFWLKHDENEWSQIAFEVMQRILIERLGELPEPEALTSSVPLVEEQKKKDYSLGELTKIINDDEPEFYDPDKVALLIKWVFRFMKLIIILYVIKFILNFVSQFDYYKEAFLFSNSSFMVFMTLGSVLVTLLISLIVTFFELKVLGNILKILREMEINSRKP